MATYPSQFVGPLVKAQHSQIIRETLGTDVMTIAKDAYNMNLTLMTIVAMLMKIVQDLAPGTVTDAFLQDRLNHSIDTGPEGWPGWLLLQVRPEDLAKYRATEFDDAATLQQKIDAYNARHPQGAKAS